MRQATKYNLFIGIDPAFRDNGFAMAIIDKTDNTVLFKMFKNGFLDFCSWFLHDSPADALICVENEKKAVTDEIEKIAEYIPDDILAQMSIYRQKKYIELRQQIEKL